MKISLSDRFLAALMLASVLGAPSFGAPPAARPRMEVVFVLDTTGSMGGMIEGAKRKLWALASRLKSAEPTPEIRFGLVAYRDQGDEYVTKVSPLTVDLDQVYSELMAFEAEGGGDTPEAVAQALDAALNEIQWSADAGVLRAIFLVGDAPPQPDSPDRKSWRSLAREAAGRGILVNGLQCGADPETANVWREVARLASGSYATITAGSSTVALETRFDADIVGMNRALNATIVPYGAAGDQRDIGRSRGLLEAMTAEGVADRAMFLERSGAGAVTTSRGDLVTEIMAGRITIETIDPALLEPALAALPPAERSATIQRQIDRRRRLLAEMPELLAQRDKVISEKLSAAQNEGEVIELSPFMVVEEQAKAHGYRFGKR